MSHSTRNYGDEAGYELIILYQHNISETNGTFRIGKSKKLEIDYWVGQEF